MQNHDYDTPCQQCEELHARVAALQAEVARLTAELDATPPTLDWLRETFGGQPEITTASTGYETYKWSCGVRFHTAHSRVTGNTGLTLSTRAAVRAHVEAMKGAK